MQLACVKCGKQWEANREPVRCANKDCRDRHWKGDKASVQSSVQVSSVQPASVQVSKPVSKVEPVKAGPWNGQATSEYRQCRECGKEFHSNKNLTAMQQHVDHLVTHQWTGWGGAYAIIQATKHKSQPAYQSANR